MEAMNWAEATHVLDASALCLVAKSPYELAAEDMQTCEGCPFVDQAPVDQPHADKKRRRQHEPPTPSKL